MSKPKRKYIDDLIDELASRSAPGDFLDLDADDLRKFAEKVYRYAMRNRKQKARDKVVKEMFKEPQT